MSAQFEHPDFPREIADAPDVDNVPVAESMHVLMECTTEIYHGVRQILESMSPEATAERARVIAPLAMELARELEQPAPSLPTQDGDDDGREAAPLDPAKVKAGDTVTLRVGSGDLPTLTIAGLTHKTINGVYLGGWRIDRLPDYVTLTAHQPAPEPEPEWLEGDVADVAVRGCWAADLSTLRAIRTDAGWRTARGDWSDVNVEAVTPLVVIDPAAVDVADLTQRAQGAVENGLGLSGATEAILATLGIEATS